MDETVNPLLSSHILSIYNLSDHNIAPNNKTTYNYANDYEDDVCICGLRNNIL